MMIIEKGSREVMKGERKETLYCLKADTLVGEIEATQTDNSRLWHKRLAHISEGGLIEL